MSSNIRVNKICQYCGKEFEARKTTSMTCSDYCAKMLYKQRQRQQKVQTTKAETQRIKTKPIEDLKAKEFLTVREVAKLLNCSRQTVYDIINRGNLKAVNLKVKKTIVKRSEIDKLFELPMSVSNEIPPPVEFVESECYNVAEVRKKYGISQTALRNLIVKHNISTFYKGWFAYVPKTEIDKLFA